MENKIMHKPQLTAFLLWQKFLILVDQQMRTDGFQHITTPTLVPSGAMEAELEPFETEFRFGQKKIRFQLPTSPEFHLKKALSMGLHQIYEIKKCFRNEEISACHRPEFTMLEFYKTNISMEDFQSEVLAFILKINQLSLRLKQDIRTELEHDKVINPKYSKKSVEQLFKSIGCCLSPRITREELLSDAKKLGVYIDEKDDLDDIYFKIWLEKIEPHLDPQELILVKDYLPSQSALAEINSESWADRFEIYWKGFELGNAFNELRSSEELAKRWASQNLKRTKIGKREHPIDKELIEVNSQLPQCCGIAIGLERLFMAIFDYKNISEFDIFNFKI